MSELWNHQRWQGLVERFLTEFRQLHRRDVEAEKLREALQRYKGDRNMPARALGISRTTLWRRMKRLDLDE